MFIRNIYGETHFFTHSIDINSITGPFFYNGYGSWFASTFLDETKAYSKRLIFNASKAVSTGLENKPYSILALPIYIY